MENFSLILISIKANILKIFNISLLIFLSIPVFCQNNDNQIDNKKNTVKDTKAAFKAVSDSVYFYLENDIQNATKQINKLEQISKKVKDAQIHASFCKTKGYYYSSTNKSDSAIIFFKKGLSYLEKIQNQTIDDLILKAEIYNAIAITYHRVELYAPSLDAHFKAINLAEYIYKKEPNNIRNNTFLSWSYGDLAATYSYTPDIKNTKKYFLIGINFSKKHSDDYVHAINLFNYAVFLLDIKELDSALSCFNISKDKLNIENSAAEYIAVNLNIAKINIIKKEFVNAKNLLNKAIELAIKSDITYYLAESYLILSDLYIKTDDLNSALQTAIVFKQTSSKTNSSFLIKESEKLLAEIYERKGNYKKANIHLRKYVELIDSLKTIELKNRVNNLNINFLLEKSNLENKQLKEKSDLQIARSKSQKNYFIIISIIGFILLISLILTLYFFIRNRKTVRNLRRINNQLQTTTKDLTELNEFQNSLFAIISHDLRGPIGTSKTLIEIINEDKNMSTEEKQKLMKIIEISVGSTYNLVENLLYWSKNKMLKSNYGKQHISPKSLIDDILKSINSTIFTKEIEIINEISDELELNSVEEFLKISLRNLITNAIKFTPRLGQIRIWSEKTENKILIHIEDTGNGLSKEQIEYIFNKGVKQTKKGTENEPGSGIGLMITMDLIEKLGGKLSCKSELKVGSIFTISLPNS